MPSLPGVERRVCPLFDILNSLAVGDLRRSTEDSNSLSFVTALIEGRNLGDLYPAATTLGRELRSSGLRLSIIGILTA